MKKIVALFVFVQIVFSSNAQNDTIYGMNFTSGNSSGNLQFASLQISSGNTTLFGNGPVTPDIFQGGVYDFDPINKRYFYPRGFSNAQQLITIDALNGGILYNPTMTCSTPSVIPITNIAYNWINDTLYGTHHANENGQTTLRFAHANIQTGAVSIVNNTPISTSPYIAGNSDIDPINGRYFLIDGNTVKTIDVTTGAVTSLNNIQFPLGVSGEYLLNIAYNWSNGQIYGLYMYPDSTVTNPSAPNGLLKLASLDPLTGQLSVVSQNPISQDGIVSGDCDIDVIGNRYFYIRQNGLHLVDLTTGVLLSIQTIQNPNNAVAPIINMAYDDLKLPQTSPATLSLSDTIYKIPGQTIQINAYVHQNAIYNWSDGSTTSIINTSQPGLYSVTVTVDGFEIYGQTMVIDQALSNVEETESNFNVFPNPTEGLLNLDFTNISISPVQLQIFAVDGKRVFTKEFESVIGQNTLQLTLDDLTKGSYVLKLSSDNFSLNRLVVLK